MSFCYIMLLKPSSWLLEWMWIHVNLTIRTDLLSSSSHYLCKYLLYRHVGFQMKHALGQILPGSKVMYNLHHRGIWEPLSMSYTFIKYTIYTAYSKKGRNSIVFRVVSLKTQHILSKMSSKKHFWDVGCFLYWFYRLALH